jgi:hypothetical protein
MKTKSSQANIKQGFEREYSFFDEIYARFKEVYFNALYQLLQKYDIGLLPALILSTIEIIQILIFPFDDQVIFLIHFIKTDIVNTDENVCH